MATEDEAPQPESRVLVEDRDGVRSISLNRPRQHNAMDDQLVTELGAAVATAVESDVRVIVVRGEGRSFSSGRDTRAIGDHSARGGLGHMRWSQAVNSMIAASRKPVIAELHGYVLGKACELALAADIRIAADDVQIALPEVDHALVTDNGGTTRLTILVGPSRAKYMLMTGTRVDAATALAWGLVDRVVPREELRTVTDDLARALARKPPLALSFAKEIVDQVHEATVTAGMRSETFAQLFLFDSDDRAELRQARAEQREPSFRGR